MTDAQVNVYNGDDRRRERLEDEAGERKYKAESHGAMTFHLEEPNSSTVSNGVADNGRKRFSVNFDLRPGSTWTSM